MLGEVPPQILAMRNSGKIAVSLPTAGVYVEIYTYRPSAALFLNKSLSRPRAHRRSKIDGAILFTRQGGRGVTADPA
jgi:hypothetical protein